MSDSISEIIHYYKNVIEYSDLTEVNVLAEPAGGRYPIGGYPITKNFLSLGKVDEGILPKLFGDSQDNLIDVTIAFDAFKSGKRFKAAMWITASLKRDGTLNISEFPNCTIAKSYLIPFVNYISVGSSFDEFTETQKEYRLAEIEEWDDYIGAIFSIKEKLIKKIEIEFSGRKSQITDTKNYIFKGNLVARLNANILSIYQEGVKSNIHSELSGKAEKVALQDETYKKEAKITLTPKLSGALLGTKFIPNLEQWRGIETVLKSEQGELTAIAGPPGTGKTSLIQFVVASGVVNSVCDGSSHPNLTTICSTNNQAVTNAVESLAIDSADRWIQADIGLGMYLPAGSINDVDIPNMTINKSSTNNKYYINGHYIEPFLQWEQFLKMKQVFLEKARKDLQLTEYAGIGEIERVLRERVLSSQGELKFSCFKSKARTLLRNGLFGIFTRNYKSYYDLLKKIGWEEHLELMKSSFADAMHYWEARFIAEIDNRFIAQGKSRKLAFESALDAIKVISLLTPFFGMTLHQLAKNFGTASNPEIALESIGLLILDEAGQVCPEIGFFSFLLAEKALVVGDSMQLEPIPSISDNEDVRLARDNKIKVCFKSSQGNFMDLATASADYSTSLLEHYRCHPDIISISNELCYENTLIPKTSTDYGLYPPLSFLDVYGVCQREVSGSLKNSDESNAIISWIVQERSKIEAYYKQDIKDVVAIVTPFKKHADDINKGLVQKGIKDIIVGTVHKLQGAEFPIVVFAPTYTMEYIRSSVEGSGKFMFFDVSPSMINVAVSRAKKSFIYIGDPRILNYGNENEILPSQILSKHLGKNATPLEYDGSTAMAKLRDETERVSSLDRHREILREVFEEAQDRIVISSPFMRERAIDADSIEKKIKKAVKRGVKVIIFYDSQMNKSYDRLGKCVKLLEKAGANMVDRNRLHSKVLYIDNKMIIESSFNWLSAVRNKGSEYQNYESSLLYRGESASKMITDAEKELRGY